MNNYPPITLDVNRWLSSLTTFIVYAQNVYAYGGTETNKLLASCLDISVPNGNGKVITTADILAVRDYSETSSLLTVTKPTAKEQYIKVENYKTIPLSINRYLLQSAFINEGYSSEFIGYVMSIMVATKDIHMYKELIKEFERYTPTGDQLIEIELYDVSTVRDVADVNKIKTQNTNKIYNVLLDLVAKMTSPTDAYNEQGFTQMISQSELRLNINSKFANEMTINTLATLLKSEKISTNIYAIDDIIAIPENQLTEPLTTIGWLMQKKKIQYGYHFSVGTEFNDGSNLMHNYWLHFAYYLDTVDGYAGAKIVANYIPVPVPALDSNEE